ncbi:MAG: GDSL-type esterase/lipase family protein [Kiritimatiellales bacterium]
MQLSIISFFFAVSLYGYADTGVPIKVAVAGSSACESYYSGSPELIWGWGEVIGNYFKPGVAVLNHAKSGRSTTSFVAEGLWKNLLADKPDYILMTLGANDTTNKPGYTDPKTTFRDNLRRYAADADAAGARIIFVTLNTAMNFNAGKTGAVFHKSGKAIRRERIEHSLAIREVAAELNKPCLELWDNQVREWEELGEERAAGLYRITSQGTIDPSHTNKEGAERIARIIMRELAASESPLAAYVDLNAVEADAGKAAGR